MTDIERSTIGRRPRPTTILLLCGAVSGPLFVAVLFIDGITMPGFSFAHDLISLLSIGPHGFVQILNFAGCGGLCVLGAIGMRQLLRGTPGGSIGPLFLALHGLFLVLVAVFVTDPANGFPVGAIAPAHPSVHGAVHALGALWVFVTGAISVIFLSRHFIARRESAWTTYCLLSGVAMLALFFPAFVMSSAAPFVDAALVIGWMAISIVSVKLQFELRLER